ncbi:MAG TPA: hypothetical protein VIA09_02570 [Nitrososphaeraceae archaeon]
MPKEIRSVCLKCGEFGIQNVFAPNKKYPHQKYLRFQHGKNKFCYIGRVRTSSEAMGELNEPQTVEEYRTVIREIVKYGNSLLEKKYGHAGPTMRRELKAILDNYGLWD